MASRAATGRVVAILVALVLALASAFLIWRYVDQADQRAMSGVQLVDVFVAAGDIPQAMTANTAFSQGLIESSQIPQANLPSSPVADLQDISGLAATGPIFTGQVLVLPAWGDPTLTTSDLDIPPDQVAMSLQVGTPQGVSGFIVPGDQIGIIVHLPVDAPNTVLGPDGSLVVQEDPDAAEGAVSESRFIVGNIEVLSVGRRVIVTSDQTGEATDELEQTEQVLITVAVSPEVAEKLSYIAIEGQMYFTLLPKDYVLPETPGRTSTNLFQP